MSDTVSLLTILLCNNLLLTSILFITIGIQNAVFNLSDRILNKVRHYRRQKILRFAESGLQNERFSSNLH